MKEYTFEVKMYAVIPIKASDLRAAGRAIESAIDQVELKVPIPGMDDTATAIEVPIYVDDVEFPYLLEVDGVSADEIDDLEG